MKATAEDIDIMARTLYGEARGQSFEGQLAVAYVILNRARERNQSIKRICLAKKQFSCWNEDDPNRLIIEAVGLNNDKFVRCFGITCLAITNDLRDPTGGANHYYNPKVVSPSWANSMKVLTTIGDHEFLTDRS